MERIKNLNLYQKCILLLLAVMFIFFTVTYIVVTLRVGYAYEGAIFVPHEEDGNTVYAARLNWQDASFTVTKDGVVTYRYGDKVFGPYTVKEDPTAIPKNHEDAEYMIGVEIRDGDEIFFRGGFEMVGNAEPMLWMYNEDGSSADISSRVYQTDGTVYEDGKEIDRDQPRKWNILELVLGPELTNKGVWLSWFVGVIFCIMTAAEIMFAEELYQWRLSFSVKYAYEAEPTDMEIASRYIYWTALTVAAIVVFVWGLTGYSETKTVYDSGTTVFSRKMDSSSMITPDEVNGSSMITPDEVKNQEMFEDTLYEHKYYAIDMTDDWTVEEQKDYLTTFYKNGEMAAQIEVNDACEYCSSTDSILVNLFGMHGVATDVKEDVYENAFGTYSLIKADVAYVPSAAEQVKGTANQKNELHYIFTDNKMFTLDIHVNTEVLDKKEIDAFVDSVMLTEAVADLLVYEKGKTVSVMKEDVERCEEHFRNLGYKDPKAAAVEYCRERMALFDAAVNNGTAVTDEEIRAYLDELRIMLEMEENKGQYEAVLSGFESEEAYWEYEYEVYRIDLPIQRYVKELEKDFMNSEKAREAEDAGKLWGEEFERIKKSLVKEQGFVTCS